MDGKTVLAGILKNRKDLALLLKKHWYRIPLEYAPTRKFQYLAFYQPILFGKQGKVIRYYGKVLGYKIVLRREILPDEPKHPRATEKYLRFRIGKIKSLARPIRNTSPRRMSFGFFDLKTLLVSKNILELYKVAPTEEIIGKALKKAGISVKSQYRISVRGKRYRLDFAVFCRKGKIAVECDNRKAHSGKRRLAKDRIKDAFLRRNGWKVIRLSEKDILSDLDKCISRIKKSIRACGGVA